MFDSESLERLFCNYIDKFGIMTDKEHDETFKWAAVGPFQEHRDLTS